MSQTNQDSNLQQSQGDSRETKAQFAAIELLAQAPAAVGLLSGPEHRWTYVNEQCVRATGRASAADLLGKTFAESLPELAGERFAAILDEVYRGGEPYVGREAKVRLNRAASGQPEEAYFDFVC